MKKYTKGELAKRDTGAEISKQNLKLSENTLIRNLFDTINLPLSILNEKRQIVYANEKAAEFYNAEINEILGKRHGECLNCVNAYSGCGVADYCIYCGAFNAIINSLSDDKPSAEECRILSKDNQKIVAYDLLIKSSPLVIGGVRYLLVIFEDISVEKRKKTLERIFFHDVLNTINGLHGLIDYLAQKTYDEETDEIIKNLVKLSNRLADEVISQRDLIAAEKGELKVKLSIINAKLIFDELIKQTIFLIPNNNLSFKVENFMDDINFVSDNNILKRILFNMIKNAAEAINFNGEITLGASLINNENVLFFVNNKTYIEPEAQAQIFQRNFSTKSPTRGLGTFSMKLLGENFLKGEVYFESDREKGTTFYLQLPIINIENEENNENL